MQRMMTSQWCIVVHRMMAISTVHISICLDEVRLVEGTYRSPDEADISDGVYDSERGGLLLLCLTASA